MFRPSRFGYVGSDTALRRPRHKMPAPPGLWTTTASAVGDASSAAASRGPVGSPPPLLVRLRQNALDLGRHDRLVLGRELRVLRRNSSRPLALGASRPRRSSTILLRPFRQPSSIQSKLMRWRRQYSARSSDGVRPTLGGASSVQSTASHCRRLLMLRGMLAPFVLSRPMGFPCACVWRCAGG